MAVLPLMSQPVPKNVTAWRLNNAEKAELKKRVADGESEAEAQYSLQLAKALANESRTRAALAVATNASEASG